MHIKRWFLRSIPFGIALASFGIGTTVAQAYALEGCWWPQSYIDNLTVSGSFHNANVATAFWASTNDWTGTPTKVVMNQVSPSANPDITGVDGNYGATGWIGQTSYGCWPWGYFYVPVKFK